MSSVEFLFQSFGLTRIFEPRCFMLTISIICVPHVSLKQSGQASLWESMFKTYSAAEALLKGRAKLRVGSVISQFCTMRVLEPAIHLRAL